MLVPYEKMRTVVTKSVPIRARISNCLQTYELSSDHDVARTARGLLKHWNHLFTFLDHESVEPTNNPAERGIRPAVQWRKICFGNQSENGEPLTGVGEAGRAEIWGLKQMTRTKKDCPQADKWEFFLFSERIVRWPYAP
jgi:Transposase IS66 family